MNYKLVIGNRNYSSWSLRAWLHLKASGEDCEIVMIPLHTDNYKEKVLVHSPSGRVPCLKDDRLPSDRITVWDSMAIMEHVTEQSSSSTQNDNMVTWPVNQAARAHARSIAMHGNARRFFGHS